MKKIFHIIVFILVSGWINISCDDQIYPDLSSTEPVIVINAWVNTLPGTQEIDVYYTQSYFNNSDFTGVTGAQVFLEDNEGNRFDFVEDENGKYIWTPGTGETFGTIGRVYDLTVQLESGEVTFQSSARLKEAPPVDSITFRYEKNDFIKGEDAFIAEFWSRDLIGVNDYYWIKSFKNDQFLNKPSEINIAVDAGFTENDVDSDGKIFIQPIRDGINPFDEVPDEELFYPPYEDGDEVYVEVHSISAAAYNYFTQIVIQTDRPGGFAEFFAQPLSNIDTNIIPSDGSTSVLGFFCVSDVKGNSTTLDISTVPREE